MPLWLLEHKDPKAAQRAGHEVRSIVVSANDEDAARDMAGKEQPTDKAREKRPGKPYLDEAPAEDLWTDRDRTAPILQALMTKSPAIEQQIDVPGLVALEIEGFADPEHAK